MNAASDVLIIGGGVIGLAIAVELKLRGATVTLLCRDFQAAASHAAAGMLAPQAEQIPPGPMLDLCLQSRSLYPEWTRKLEELSGKSTGYWACGILAPVYEIQESGGASCVGGSPELSKLAFRSQFAQPSLLTLRAITSKCTKLGVVVSGWCRAMSCAKVFLS